MLNRLPGCLAGFCKRSLPTWPRVLNAGGSPLQSPGRPGSRAAPAAESCSSWACAPKRNEQSMVVPAAIPNQSSALLGGPGTNCTLPRRLQPLPSHLPNDDLTPMGAPSSRSRCAVSCAGSVGQEAVEPQRLGSGTAFCSAGSGHGARAEGTVRKLRPPKRITW